MARATRPFASVFPIPFAHHGESFAIPERSSLPHTDGPLLVPGIGVGPVI